MKVLYKSRVHAPTSRCALITRLIANGGAIVTVLTSARMKKCKFRGADFSKEKTTADV